MQLTQYELGLLELSLAEMIYKLKNNFKPDDRYVHPAIKYEALYERFSAWIQEADGGEYSLTPVVSKDAVLVLVK